MNLKSRLLHFLILMQKTIMWQHHFHPDGWDEKMFFTKDTNLFGKRLNVFRGCFSKPQWTHLKIYLHGLLLGEKGEKNIQDIASNVLDGKHQSSLNRFLTKRKWSTRKLNAIRLKENIHDRKGGVIALDDMLIEKSGKQMDGVGYLKDHCSGKTVLSHNIVSTFYRNGKQRIPLYGQLYFKKMLLVSWISGLKQRFRSQWICFVCHWFRWILKLLFLIPGIWQRISLIF